MVADRITGVLQRTTVTGGHRFGPLAQVRWLQVALWLLVISGPIAAIVLAFHVGGLDSRIDELSDREPAISVADSAGAEGFAELYVASVLAADGDTAEGLSGIVEPPAGGASEGGWFASRTVSLGAEELAPGYFAVTVAVELVAEDADSQPEPAWVAVGTRFYTVGVVESDSGWVATGLPTLVARPTGPPPPELLVTRMDGLDALPELERAIAAFLAAYLTGVGDLARYTVPGSLLVAVEPAPFVTVEITRAGSATAADGAQLVAAVVRATDAAGRSQVLEYSLVVSQREGRWEVAELLPAAPLGQ